MNVEEGRTRQAGWGADGCGAPAGTWGFLTEIDGDLVGMGSGHMYAASHSSDFPSVLGYFGPGAYHTLSWLGELATVVRIKKASKRDQGFRCPLRKDLVFVEAHQAHPYVPSYSIKYLWPYQPCIVAAGLLRQPDDLALRSIDLSINPSSSTRFIPPIIDQSITDFQSTSYFHLVPFLGF